MSKLYDVCATIIYSAHTLTQFKRTVFNGGDSINGSQQIGWNKGQWRKKKERKNAIKPAAIQWIVLTCPCYSNDHSLITELLEAYVECIQYSTVQYIRSFTDTPYCTVSGINDLPPLLSKPRLMSDTLLVRMPTTLHCPALGTALHAGWTARTTGAIQPEAHDTQAIQQHPNLLYAYGMKNLHVQYQRKCACAWIIARRHAAHALRLSAYLHRIASTVASWLLYCIVLYSNV